jgi:hypothetical protein
MSETTASPKWILFLLWPFKGEPCYPQIEGDLAEEFQQRTTEYGIRSARLWYYKEICRNLLFLTCRWVTIPVIILPLLCMIIQPFLLNLYSALWGLLIRSFSWILLFFDVLFSSLVGLAFAEILCRFLNRHERMSRLAFGLFSLVFVGMWNEPMALNLWHGMRVPATAIPQLFIYLRPSFMFIWTLICFWIGSVGIERKRRGIVNLTSMA